MQVYQHLLLATDLSPKSDKIGQHALSLANLFNAQLSIVHVIDLQPTFYAGGEFALPVTLNTLDESVTKKIGDKLISQAHALNISHNDCWLVKGDKQEEISHLVKQQQCDLIIIGAHDKHGIAKFFHSTPEDLLHSLPCDILTVKA